MTGSWVGAALLSAIFAAAVAIFGKIGLRDVDTTLSTTIRSLIMAGFLIVVSLVLGKTQGLAAIGARPLTFIVLSEGV